MIDIEIELTQKIISLEQKCKSLKAELEPLRKVGLVSGMSPMDFITAQSDKIKELEAEVAEAKWDLSCSKLMIEHLKAEPSEANSVASELRQLLLLYREKAELWDWCEANKEQLRNILIRAIPISELNLEAALKAAGKESNNG